jgi:hypothetical protein
MPVVSLPNGYFGLLKAMASAVTVFVLTPRPVGGQETLGDVSRVWWKKKNGVTSC